MHSIAVISGYLHQCRKQSHEKIHYYFNYSNAPIKVVYPHKAGKELLGDKAVLTNAVLDLEAWGVRIVEEN